MFVSSHADLQAHISRWRRWRRLVVFVARVTLVACGTSYYASLLGKYMIEQMAGIPCEVDLASDEIREESGQPDNLESRMRGVVELMALALQGSMLTRVGASEVAEAFCASRLGPRWRGAFGALPDQTDLSGIVARVAN